MDDSRLHPSEKPINDRATLLIVEDEDLMLRLLEKYFSRHGYDVLVASDGEQAVDVYHDCKGRIDAVLLDSGMPKTGGENVFYKMKYENAALKVVMASGYLDPEQRDALEFAGVTRFVTKPYRLDELLAVFRSVIEEK
jgi:two-component system, cell cycle sensor histidine kinase and response regulator CckA